MSYTTGGFARGRIPSAWVSLGSNRDRCVFLSGLKGRCVPLSGVSGPTAIHVTKKHSSFPDGFHPGSFHGSATTFRGINVWLTEEKIPPVPKLNAWWELMHKDDRQDDMQPPCPPQNIFSMCVPWPVSRHSEPLIPETDENRLSAHVTGRPRPPRRLQL